MAKLLRPALALSLGLLASPLALSLGCGDSGGADAAAAGGVAGDAGSCEQEPCLTGGGGSGAQAATPGGGGSAEGGAVSMGPEAYDNDCDVTGEFRNWHRVSVVCSGPEVDESDSTFTDYRMVVTFTNGSEVLEVPGHFAADGDAANTSAQSGGLWRAHLMPTLTGKWSYSVSFRTGSNVAVSTDSAEGESVAGIDGAQGAFDVAQTNKSGRDMRAHGLLEHRAGERYLRHRGSDRVYIEGGVDSPENLFGYDEFDDTTKHDDVGSCKGILHEFAAHEQDWNDGDPSWDGGRGKSLVGVINYLSTTGVNAIYLVPMSEQGDGCDGHPWKTYGGNHRAFDVSKLEQWETVFSHMTEKGFLIHFVTQETENDGLLNGGDLGLERKLYYREMISRFGHHPALQWNIGEENTNSAAQQKDFATYFKSTDAYEHAVLLHTYPGQHDRYDDLLGFADFDGPTLQYGAIPESATGGLYGETADWLSQSASAGVQWVVTATEASGGDAPTPNSTVSSRQRIYWMYANAMAGGGGTEWYLKNDGSGHAYDLSVEDMREFDDHWQQMGHLVDFFNAAVPGDGYDLENFSIDNAATSTGTDWVLSDGTALIVFLREGGALNLAEAPGAALRATWVNPRTGERTDGGTISGTSVGSPPSEGTQDWIVWLRP